MAGHDQVAHNWAHQTGKARKGFNMFYEGEVIYSYGYHFAIAKHVTLPDGSAAVLMTTEGYSISTAKHKEIVWRAVRHLQTFNVANVKAIGAHDHRQNHAGMLASAEEALKKAVRARTWAESHLNTATALINAANKYNEAFALGLPVASLPEDMGAVKAKVAEVAKAARKAKAEVEAKKAAAALEWVRGERDYAPNTDRPYVRVKGDTLETSWGIKVPLEAALPVFKLAERCAERHSEYVPTEPILVGGWRLDRITSQGTIRAGCHLITLDRARLAAQCAGILSQPTHVQQQA